MVQVQSSWFPLYDRNPQTFVPNIFWAKPEDYRQAAQRVYHAPDKASFIELPVVEGPEGPGTALERGRMARRPAAASLGRRLAGVIGYEALFAALLFIPAGTLRGRGDGFSWPSCSSCASGAPSSSTVPSRSCSPNARGRSSSAVSPSRTGVLLIASWRPTRRSSPSRRWTRAGSSPAAPPAAISWAALILFAAGWIVVALALRENEFAIAVVRLPGGARPRRRLDGAVPVRRHPLYSGLSAVMIGMGLWLGSLAAAVASAVPIGILAARIVLEERLLSRSLPGYAEYATRVRSRLVPGIW